MNNLKYLVLEYIKVETHTNTELENNVLEFFKKWFNSVDYFKDNPSHYGFYEIQNDRLKRSVPWALLKGKGNKTVVLIHHHDTVDIEDYGINKKYAYNPQKLEEIFKSKTVKLDSSTKEDLESGEWLFGRGVADMKGGGAIQLHTFEEYSKQNDFKGNIVLLSVADEENLSAGARSSISLLKELKLKYDLDYQVMIDCEPHDRIEKDKFTIYSGSIGKLMPMFMVKGKLSHVGEVYKGLNPVSVLTRIASKTEMSYEFVEKVGNTVTPPPVWLNLRDCKEVYDVSLPLYAAGYLSVLTFKQSPSVVLEKLKKISLEAFEEVIADLQDSFKRYKELMGNEYEAIDIEPRVCFYHEIYQELSKKYPIEFVKDMEQFERQLLLSVEANEIDKFTANNKMMEKMLEYYGANNPIVVIGLAAPYYPSVHNTMIDSGIYDVVEKVKEKSKRELNLEIYNKDFYTSISDLSYAMFTMSDKNIDYIENNIIFWDKDYSIPLKTIKELSMPVLNIGPYGKNLHKFSERVNKLDLLENTPKILKWTIEEILK